MEMPWGNLCEIAPSRIRRLFRRTEGQDLIEYALLIAILSVVLISTLSGVGTKVSDMWGMANTALPADDSGGATPGQNGNNGNNGNPGNSNPSNGNPGNSNPSNGNPGNSNPSNGKGN